MKTAQLMLFAASTLCAATVALADDANTSPADRNSGTGAAAHLDSNSKTSKGKSGWTKAARNATKDHKAGSADGSTGMTDTKMDSKAGQSPGQ